MTLGLLNRMVHNFMKHFDDKPLEEKKEDWVHIIKLVNTEKEYDSEFEVTYIGQHDKVEEAKLASVHSIHLTHKVFMEISQKSGFTMEKLAKYKEDLFVQKLIDAFIVECKKEPSFYDNEGKRYDKWGSLMSFDNGFEELVSVIWQKVIDTECSSLVAQK